MSELTTYPVQKLSIYGTSNIGAFSTATDSYVIIPPDVPDKVVQALMEILKVRIVKTFISHSTLVGVFTVGNSHGIVLPHTVADEEIEIIKRELRDINIAILKTKLTALGNLVAVNDRAAVASLLLPPEDIKAMEDALGVEVIQMKICNLNVVGSLIVATNRGVLVTPDATDDEIAQLREIFKLPVSVGTVNRGRPFVRAGLIANSNGALVGDETTGPEIMRITQALSGVLT
ncbi:MAG: translation initiation factor IF-6 [Thermoprotei archaeon]|nr:MAG: translation initiation factor IF-6 [Thermoprotei archaeon]